jgi:hypothetical protein
MALTIIVPFLGSLILFNQYVIDLLTLSPDLIRRWVSVPGETAEATARSITLNRLYFVYFGLCALGMGSALFAVLCPLVVKEHISSRDYVTSEAQFVTPARMSLILPFSANEFVEWFGTEYIENPSISQHLGQPDDFEALFSEVAKQLYLAIPPDDPPEDNPPPTEGVGATSEAPQPEAQESAVDTPFEETSDPLFPLEDHRGRPDPHKIIECIWAQRQVDAYLWMPFFSEANKPEHKGDVLTLHYMALDHTKPWFRLAIASLYAIGFALLFWPTLLTFVRVVLSALGF